MDNKLTMEIFDKVLSGDFTTEVSMPDYEAEVRRLLHVSATLTDPLWYADGGRIGMNGEILYRILYSGSDGELYETEARESYDIAEAYKGDRPVGTVFCEVYPESIISRVIAPRKLSIKCRIRGVMKAFSENDIYENLSYIENPASIERLTDEIEYVRLMPSTVGEFTVEEAFPLSTADDARIISSRAAIYCDGVESGNGEVTVKGNAHVTVLIEDGDGAVSTMEERIPIREFIEADGVTPSTRCACRLSVSDCTARMENGEMLIEISATAKLFPAEYATARYTKDLYSTEYESAVTKKTYAHTKDDLVFMGSLTESFKENDTSLDGAKILDVIPYASVKGVTVEDGRAYLLGDVTLSIIYEKDGEEASRDLKWQFKYEIPNREGIKFSASPALLYSSACVTSPKAKLEGGSALFGCELHLSGRLCSSSSFEAVDSGTFGKEFTKEDGITVCFKDPSASLWETAKANHVKESALLFKNGNSEDESFFII